MVVVMLVYPRVVENPNLNKKKRIENWLNLRYTRPQETKSRSGLVGYHLKKLEFVRCSTGVIVGENSLS